jgi:DNA-binding XRE family transcriptional regulator
MANTNDGLMVPFTDKYGRERTIHKKADGGLAVKRLRQTPALALNQVAGRLVGNRIREARCAAGLTMEELCVKAGLSSATPKQRMWEIEKGTRKEGVRLGTLYAIAAALGIEAQTLLPTTEELLQAAGVSSVTVTTLSVVP